MLLSSNRLLEILQTYPETNRFWLAYSGGRDSHVLLHLLAGRVSQLPAPLTAVHLNHGLQADAAEWEAHCRSVCQTLGIAFVSRSLGLSPAPGKSVEALARDARYQALAEFMDVGDVLLTAHHQDDQAETVLLQLLRGAGTAGLAAMPELANFPPGYYGRPLLMFSGAEVSDYAQRNDLRWIEDGSNQDQRFDRNYLRKQVIPVLRQRWPALAQTLSRSAQHCGEAQTLVDRFAGLALGRLLDTANGSLDLAALLDLPAPEQRAVLRHWIRDSGYSIPDTARLNRVLSEIPTAAIDRSPSIRWPGAEVRRYRSRLYIRKPLPLMDMHTVLAWDGVSTLELPALLGRLQIQDAAHGIAYSHWRDKEIQVRFRHGKERLRVAGDLQSRSFKNYYQRLGIPPWLRLYIPLVYLDGELAAVADICVCEPYAAGTGERAVRIEWLGHDFRELGPDGDSDP